MVRAVACYLWLGLTLTLLFFYPLISSLKDGEYYMQWQVINSIELGVCVLLGMVVVGLCLAFANKLKNRYIRSFLIAAICCVPFASFFIHLVRQMKLADLLIQAEDIKIWGISFATMTIGVIFVLLILFIIKWHAHIGKIIITTVFIISPVSVILVIATIQHGMRSTPIEISLDERAASGELQDHPNIYVFLFDELDYDFLYKDGKVSKEYPNFHRFSESAINYHAATAPDVQTLTSIPGLLLSTRGLAINVCGDRLCSVDIAGDTAVIDTANDNLFKKAQSKGYSTGLIGWTHPYCNQFGSNLDFCRSYSLYNYGTAEKTFSLLNPIRTNVILWPHQYPFGLVKNPVYSLFHHQVVTETFSEVSKVTELNEPVYLFVHFSIPHMPFIYIDGKYDPPELPFLQNRRNYTDQLRYVDKLFGEIVDQLEIAGNYGSSYIVVLSDHAYRKHQPKEKWDRIPLLVYQGENTKHADITDKVKAEEILSELVN